MTVRKILTEPNPFLRQKSKSVDSVDGSTRELMDDMLETMYKAPGIGLAASQVNIHKRVIVIDISETRDEPLVLINPELSVSGEEVETDEGCLSVPGYYEPVVRKERAAVKAIDENGVPFELNATGLLAICIQHENDHLNGKLFVDYLSPLKRSRIRKKLQKLGQRGQ